MHEGKRDYYAEQTTRTLHYRVETETFPSADRATAVTEKMREATAEWERACPSCGIHFVEESDPATTVSWPGFRVRYHDTHGQYIAVAFFPHQREPDREVRIDASYFTTHFDQVGVLRHELGHVLGYRHEQIRGIPGCADESGEWSPLTPYDPHSVMHYFCGGGGSMRLDLTEIDRSGHRSLYGPPQSSSPAPSAAATPASAFLDSADSAANPQPSDRQQQFEQAVTSPVDPVRRRAYSDSLPRVGPFYVVEGDLPMTEDQIVTYLGSQSTAGSVRKTVPI